MRRLHTSYLLITLLACGTGAMAVAETPDASAVIAVSVTLDAPPTADTIEPETTGPTTSSLIAFVVTFSEDVTDFDDAADVLIHETGTVTHTEITITGGPRVYTVEIAGVAGDGTMAIEVNTASDIRDAAGNVLASSVTSVPVTIISVEQMTLVYWPVALILFAAAVLALRRARVRS